MSEDAEEVVTSLAPLFDRETHVIVKVNGRLYRFERTEEGTLVYSGNSRAADIPDDPEDKPFDSTQYR